MSYELKGLSEKELKALYDSGTTIKTISEKYHTRVTNISKALQSLGIDTRGNRGIRIGNTQKSGVKIRTKKDCILYQNIKDTEIAYIAGFFDGEGSIYGPSKYGNHRVTITQKNKKPLLWIQDKLGAGIIQYNDIANNYRINTQSEVFDFLCMVYPYVIHKKQRVYETMKYMEKRYKWDSLLPDVIECPLK